MHSALTFKNSGPNFSRISYIFEEMSMLLDTRYIECWKEDVLTSVCNFNGKR